MSPRRSIAATARTARGHAATVSARIGLFILHAARQAGLDAQALARDAGFDIARATEPDARIALALEQRLWDLAAERGGDRCFGLHAAAQLHVGAFDVLDYAVRSAPDLTEALARLVRYNRLVHDVAEFHRHDAGATCVLEHRFRDPALTPGRQAAEFTLASIVAIAAQLTGEPLRAQAVAFSHAAPDATERQALAAFFGVTPRFGAPCNQLVLNAADLRRAVRGADAGLSRIVTAHADQMLQALPAAAPGHEPLVRQLREVLAANLAHGAVTLAGAARALHLSERTLQRRLDEAGTRFTDLVDEVRKDMALRYVRDPRLALGEVAYLLGFAEPSPFHRAFRRWTGRTPLAVRREAVASPALH